MKILILTLSHGGGHERLARVLRAAILDIQPNALVEVVHALDHCASWFRAYYDSYRIPLKYWPGLWDRIESFQHSAASTGPVWLYRRGARPFFQYLRECGPDVVIATEVGLCELAALCKRDRHAPFRLIAAPALDVDRAWVQPEVDLYVSAPGEAAAQLLAAGAPQAKIVDCGVPVDPVFGLQRNLRSVRIQLGIDPDQPLLLVLFGGAGHGRVSPILPELKKLPGPLQVTFITGANPRLQKTLERQCHREPRWRVFGWINNIHDWMAAADLLLTKPGETTVCEAMVSGLPILAFGPLPGGERRLCDLIERWRIGCWVERPQHLAPLVSRLLASPAERSCLRERALALARRDAAHEAAAAILTWGYGSAR